MLDIVLLAKTVVAGGLTGAAVMRLAAWGVPSRWGRSTCWSWAIGMGTLVASGAVDQWPHWPPLEDHARFLTLLVPLTLVVETLAATMPSGGMTWIVRLALIVVVAPILLHNSVYLADLNGRNSSEWSSFQATIVLCGLAALLALIWAMLSCLQSRTSTRAVLWVLVLDALATATTVMLSGYYGGGVLGLGLAGALTGALLASYFMPPQSPTRGSLGMIVIGIFAVVLMGRFFGALSTGSAACLLLSPLLAWTVELSPLCMLAPGWRATWRLACVALPLIIVMVVAQRIFTAESMAHSRPHEPSAIPDLIEK